MCFFMEENNYQRGGGNQRYSFPKHLSTFKINCFLPKLLESYGNFSNDTSHEQVYKCCHFSTPLLPLLLVWETLHPNIFVTRYCHG